MRFALEPRPASWAQDAPAVVTYRFELASPVSAAWAVLADHRSWPRWYRGNRSTVLDQGDGELGSLRTVQVGLTRVQEEVVANELEHRLGLAVVASNVPGLRTLVEDWVLEPVGHDRCRLTVTVGAEGAGPFRLTPFLVRLVVARSTAGIAGITDVVGPTTGDER